MIENTEQKKLAERNQRIISWMVVPALIILMIAALVVPALVEPSDHPPVESIFELEETITPTVTPTPTSTPEEEASTEIALVAQQRQQVTQEPRDYEGDVTTVEFPNPQALPNRRPGDDYRRECR